MRRINRRKLLRLSTATLAAHGGLAGILASGKAPAYAQGTALHWLKFVAYNVLAKRNNNGPEIPLFVTLGSPLGLNSVKAHLDKPLAMPAG